MEAQSLPTSVLSELSYNLDNRAIERGFALLNQHLSAFAELTLHTAGVGLAARLLAEWQEAGFDDRGTLERLLGQVTDGGAAQLPVADYIQIRLAKAALATGREDIATALGHLDFVLAYGQEAGDRRAMSLANFWKARCFRKAGEYDSSLEFAQRARSIASEIPLPGLAAIIQLSESWVLFQKGSSKEAVRVLQEAEAALRHTDDYITLGNIQSAYGRIARREGRYEQALQYFERSIELFRRRSLLERHHARSLTNIAKTRRLLAVEMRRRMDAEREKRQNSRAEANEANGHKPKDLERIRQLLSDARADLERADEIYARFPSHHGAGNVQVGLSEIALDLGHLDEADRAALAAFELGSTKQDYLLMCRARIAQAMIANAWYEEQVGEAEEPSRFAQLANDCAREAVAFAEHTQSRRIMARAYIWQGLILMNGFFNSPELARACAEKAEEFLSVDRHGALWEDLKALQAKILRRSKVDPNLRAWSQGVVGDKTLQEVVEEFEAMLVSRIWEREEHKVSRVAQRLSVSPKKVRRLLRRQGLLAEQERQGDLSSEGAQLP
jgi:tetratricopeptide (TPR) repeat protein